jgi:hypothetical protein
MVGLLKSSGEMAFGNENATGLNLDHKPGELRQKNLCAADMVADSLPHVHFLWRSRESHPSCFDVPPRGELATSFTE